MKDEFEGLSVDTLRQCFELIGSPPDVELLRKYAAEKSRWHSKERLTARERKWIEANLRCNARWQEVYRTLGGPGSAKNARGSLTRIAVAAAILIAAPVWIDSLYNSGGATEQALQEAIDSGREVLRGSYSKPFIAPGHKQPVLTPSLRSLADIDPAHPDTTRLASLKQDLINQYGLAKDRFVRARAARRLMELSLILSDTSGAEDWRRRCDAEQLDNCL